MKIIAYRQRDGLTLCRLREESDAGVWFGNRIVDTRVATVSVSPAKAFRSIRRIGGQRGWYYANFLWTLRGWIDLLCGGIGKRRGRRDPEHLRVGDVLDWWRVEAYVPNQRLRLFAEMKVPGRAWLEFEVEPTLTGSSIRQTAVFDPVGLLGFGYWYGVYPLHAVIFRGMLGQIAQRAERSAEQTKKRITNDMHTVQRGSPARSELSL